MSLTLGSMSFAHPFNEKLQEATNYCLLAAVYFSEELSKFDDQLTSSSRLKMQASIFSTFAAAEYRKYIMMNSLKVTFLQKHVPHSLH